MPEIYSEATSVADAKKILAAAKVFAKGVEGEVYVYLRAYGFWESATGMWTTTPPPERIKMRGSKLYFQWADGAWDHVWPDPEPEREHDVGSIQVVMEIRY